MELSLDDVNNVRKEIHTIRSKWQDIALELGMSIKDTVKIRSDFDDDKYRLLEILQWWLAKKQPKPTWGVLIESLRSCTIEEHKLADALQRKYCPQGSYINFMLIPHACLRLDLIFILTALYATLPYILTNTHTTPHACMHTYIRHYVQNVHAQLQWYPQLISH